MVGVGSSSLSPCPDITLMRPLVLLVLAISAATPMAAQQAVPAQAADAPTHEATHKELRELRDAFVQAVNGGDIMDILSFLDRDFVFTGPNGDTVRGHRGVSDYFKTAMIGANRTMVALQVSVEPDSLAILAPDEAWALTYGAGHARCQLEDGRALNLDGRWSAVMTRTDGKWNLASVHFSTNIFANAVLTGTRTTSAWMTFAGTVLALFGGLALGRWLEQWRIRYDAEQAAKAAALEASGGEIGGSADSGHGSGPDDRDR